MLLLFDYISILKLQKSGRNYNIFFYSNASTIWHLYSNITTLWGPYKSVASSGGQV